MGSSEKRRSNNRLKRMRRRNQIKSNQIKSKKQKDFFRRKLRGTDNTWLIVPFRWTPDSGTLARFRLLSRRSERRLCMRCMATPFSSVEKSKPRWTERIPVDMSVLLAERRSIEGRGTDTTLSCVSETIEVGRRRFRALKVPCPRTRGSWVRSL